jgi:sugar phosphate isomerase/epimerase
MFAVSQVNTLAASFGDDVRAYAAAGVDGIGIWELKLADGSDSEALEQLAASGLGSSSAVPVVPSVLPLPLLPGPEAPEARIASLCASLHRLAPFAPSAVVCLTGPAGDRDPDEARARVVEGLRTVAREAESVGLRLALEPFQREGIEDWSIVNTLGEAAELIDEIGSPAVGIQFDVWHLWNTRDVLDEIPRHAHLIAGVHVNDWREPTRGWADRVLPGDGAADLPAILGVLEDVGWTGYYDLEIFSDNGAFGTAYPDSLWDIDAAELARRGRGAFTRCWSERRVTASAVGRRGDT